MTLLKIKKDWFFWPGGDLLSHALRRSTIGAEGFHGRVRDGIGCGPLAITTRPKKPVSNDKNDFSNKSIPDAYPHVSKSSRSND